MLINNYLARRLESSLRLLSFNLNTMLQRYKVVVGKLDRRMQSGFKV